MRVLWRGGVCDTHMKPQVEQRMGWTSQAKGGGASEVNTWKSSLGRDSVEWERGRERKRNVSHTLRPSVAPTFSVSQHARNIKPIPLAWRTHTQQTDSGWKLWAVRCWQTAEREREREMIYWRKISVARAPIWLLSLGRERTTEQVSQRLILSELLMPIVKKDRKLAQCWPGSL